MPKPSRQKSYWRSYRKVRTSVDHHMNILYGDSDSHGPEADLSQVNEVINDVPDSVVDYNTIPDLAAEVNIPDHSATENIPDRSATENDIQAFAPDSINLVNEDIIREMDIGEDPDINSDSDDSNSTDLNDQLAFWASHFNISHAALRELLKILNPYHDNLPKDPRTLLQTPKSYEVSEICGGLYHHFGVKSGLTTQLAGFSGDRFPRQEETLEIQVSIDGLPLFKSSSTQFWPILGRLVSPVITEPFVIGIFAGKKKPNDINIYLMDFIEEMKSLQQFSFRLPDIDCDFLVDISCFVCDAPARAFIKQIKAHNGYYGCEKCVTRGFSIEKRMTFPETSAELRTDVQFDEMVDTEHHNAPTILRELNVGMISQVPLDFMHLVCLGVVKKMITLWKTAPPGKGRVAAASVGRISEKLLGLRKYLPREFLRKGRALSESDRWKATEFRQFLLYTGPIALLDDLSPAMYRHFMLLSVSIYCLSSPLFSKMYVSYVRQILEIFVTDYGQLYSPEYVSYNVHGLIHLPDDVERFGPLEHFSAFVFESFLGRLKRMVRKPNYPLQQVIGRLSEKNHVSGCLGIPPTGTVKISHRNGPIPGNLNHLMQFKEIELPDVFLSVNEGNNCILIGEKVALVRNIVCESTDGDKSVVYEEFQHASNLFDYPLESNVLLIFVVSSLSGTLNICKVSDISCKCVLLPFRDSLVSIPLIHTL